jgi:hypothetical protein
MSGEPQNFNIKLLTQGAYVDPCLCTVGTKGGLRQSARG